MELPKYTRPLPHFLLHSFIYHRKNINFIPKRNFHNWRYCFCSYELKDWIVKNKTGTGIGSDNNYRVGNCALDLVANNITRLVNRHCENYKSFWVKVICIDENQITTINTKEFLTYIPVLEVKYGINPIEVREKLFPYCSPIRFPDLKNKEGLKPWNINLLQGEKIECYSKYTNLSQKDKNNIIMIFYPIIFIIGLIILFIRTPVINHVVDPWYDNMMNSIEYIRGGMNYARWTAGDIDSNEYYAQIPDYE